ncbi:MAG: magnesium/cobalt transporter CorA [Candidatus Thermoplasmatota archaeon]|nr:magnesium/cobalt transporter CorA [Candidatus Thermoplasmatota archaeon]
MEKARTKHKIGMPPGSLVYTGRSRSDRPVITLFEYGPEGYSERKMADIGECAREAKADGVRWINIDGLNDTSLLERIGREFGIHPLVIEDVLNTSQRPKTEHHESHIFIVLRMIYPSKDGGEVESEQVSIILGEGYILSFQERRGDVFDPIRDRIRTGKGRVRSLGSDYLAYCLMDSIVDSYFLVIENLGEKVESIEDEVIERPERGTVQAIHELKRQLITMRRSTWPLRESVSSLYRESSGMVKDETKLYFRDLYDHTIQVIDSIESHRDITSSMLDIYLSSVSNRMNEVMKVLTIIATIFIPLTFIAGIYGMNFDPDYSPFNMPELRWYFGYPLALTLMAAIPLVMLIYFRKRKWI